MLNTISCKLEKNCKNSDNTNKQIEKSSEIIADCTNKNLESKKREKIIDKEIKKITEIFNYQIKEEVKEIQKVEEKVEEAEKTVIEKNEDLKQTIESNLDDKESRDKEASKFFNF